MASSTSPHLCLRWNNYQSNLTNVFDQLLQNETFVDVTLAADGHAIKAHKMVLSACSPYFQALFFDNPCQHPIVILKDTRWSELKAVVEYMYRGEISVAQEELNSLLRVAETLKIRGLSELNGDRDRELHRDKMSTEEDSTSHAGSPPILGAGLVSERAAGAPNALPASTCSSGGSTGAGGGVAPGLLSAASLNGRKTDSPSSSCPLSSTNTPWGNHLISSGGAGMDDTPTPSASPALRHKRRRYSLGEGSTPPGPGSPEGSSPPTTTLHANTSGAEDSGSLDGPLPLLGHAHPSPASSSSAPSSQGFGPVSAGAPLSSTPHVADELDIKPGIAELIREEERARMLEGTHPWLAASPSVLSDPLVQWKSKAPSWSKEQLQEAIQAIVTQRMRFTQASAHYGIPKGTLYDNILGKSKRMLVLDDVGLHPADEEAVLDFCCETSAMPYNRRTNKSLESVVAYVEKLKQDKDPHFRFSGLVGFRWWWAFCKKHNIVSLYYSKNRNNNSGSNNHGSHNNNNNNNNNTSTSNRNNNNNNNNNNTQHQNHNKLSHSVLSGNNNSGHHLLHTELLKKQLALYNNNNERLAPDADKPQNLSNRHQVEDKPENLSLYANLMLPAHSLAPGHVVAHRAMAGNATSKRAAQLYPPSRSRQRKHSVEAPEEDSDLEPENLSLHKH